MTYHKAKLAYIQADAKADYVAALKHLEAAISACTDDFAIMAMKQLHKDLREKQPRRGFMGAWQRLRGMEEVNG